MDFIIVARRGKIFSVTKSHYVPPQSAFAGSQSLEEELEKNLNSLSDDEFVIEQVIPVPENQKIIEEY